MFKKEKKNEAFKNIPTGARWNIKGLDLFLGAPFMYKPSYLMTIAIIVRVYTKLQF